MTKQEMASYLINLIGIMESQEDAAIPRSETLAREYNRVFKELQEAVREEEDESNKSNSGDTANNEVTRRESISGGAAGARTTSQAATDLRR